MSTSCLKSGVVKERLKRTRVVVLNGDWLMLIRFKFCNVSGYLGPGVKLLYSAKPS
jgi:hypothetical protein